jgi:hypothetical protein
MRGLSRADLRLSGTSVVATMAADGIDPTALEAQLRSIATATAARQARESHQIG